MLFKKKALGLLLIVLSAQAQEHYAVEQLTQALANEYKLDNDFYKKSTMVQGILIATSNKVGRLAHKETAYQFDMLMRSLKPKIADRIRKKKVIQNGTSDLGVGNATGNAANDSLVIIQPFLNRNMRLCKNRENTSSLEMRKRAFISRKEKRIQLKMPIE